MATSLATAGTPPVEVKLDPEVNSKSIISQLNGTDAPVRVKYEEPDSDDNGIDNAIPIASDSDDMFDDADEEDDEDEDTEDEIVDFTYEGLVHIQGVEHFVCRAFKIRQIPQPEVRMIDLGSLFGCLEYGSIVLNPDYQREAVWDQHRASTLINSISMGYFVPPIIFNRKLVITETPDGKVSQQKKICVDGKQRLTSLFKFMSGQIGIWDSNNPQKKWYYCHPKVDGEEVITSHNIMPQAVKDFFRQRRLCCYEYEELSQDIEENMFQLVQRGIALTPAEKMRAMSTEWATFAKQYEEDYSIVVNLSKQNRASGFRSVLTIFAMIQEVMAERRARPLYPALQASPQALNKLLEDQEPINPVLKLKFKTIFDKIENLVKLSSTQLTATKYKLNKNSVFDPAPDFLREDNISHVRTFSPLELIGTAILVSYHMESRSDAELLNDVKKLRRYLRLSHKDLRVNAQCWNTVWDFIDRLGTDAEGTDPISTKVTKKRRAPARGTKSGKTKAKPQAKKSKKNKKTKKAARKAVKPPRRPTRRAKNSAQASPSSSELSSAPSFDDSDDEDFMSGLLSPLFPSLMPNKVAMRGSFIQAETPASASEKNADVACESSPKIANGASVMEDVEDANAEAPHPSEEQSRRTQLLSHPPSPNIPNGMSGTGVLNTVQARVSPGLESQNLQPNQSHGAKVPSQPSSPKIISATLGVDGPQSEFITGFEAQPSVAYSSSVSLHRSNNHTWSLEGDISEDMNVVEVINMSEDVEISDDGNTHDHISRAGRLSPKIAEEFGEVNAPKAAKVRAPQHPETLRELGISKAHKESGPLEQSEKLETPRVLGELKHFTQPAQPEELEGVDDSHRTKSLHASNSTYVTKKFLVSSDPSSNGIIQARPESTNLAGRVASTSVAEPAAVITKPTPPQDPPNIVRPDRTGIPDKPKSRFKPKAPNREERILQLNKLTEPSFPNGTPPTGPKLDRSRLENSRSKPTLPSASRPTEAPIQLPREGSSGSQVAWPNGPPPTGPSLKRRREGSSGSLPPFSKRPKESAV